MSAAQTPPHFTEVAFVANAEAGTVALVDVVSRSIIGVLDINPARAERKGPGAPRAEEGRTCLIANTRSDNLSIISIPRRVEVARLSIGNGPKHITVARIPDAVIAAFKASSISAATH